MAITEKEREYLESLKKKSKDSFTVAESNSATAKSNTSASSKTAFPRKLTKNS